MGFFTKNASKRTAKLKYLIKTAVKRLAVTRRPRLARRSIARGDVAQLLSIGHLDRALLRAEQVIEEDTMLEVLDIVELYCNILIEQAAQLDEPKECSEEIKEAAAGLMFASARCGELPELLDARAILADKFGRDFARAAKEGSHGVVDPTLVRRLSGGKASEEQQWRLAKEIAAENDILLDFPKEPENPREIRQNEQSEAVKNVPAEESVEQIEVKVENYAPSRRHASELGGGNALHEHEAHDRRGQYRTPPYRRNPTASADSNGASAARRTEDLDGCRRRRPQEGGGYESSARVVHPPYTRMVSALEGSNEHIARHEEVRRIGTDARVLLLQERR